MKRPLSCFLATFYPPYNFGEHGRGSTEVALTQSREEWLC